MDVEPFPWTEHTLNTTHERNHVLWSMREAQRQMRLPLNQRVIEFEIYGGDLTGPDRHAVLQSIAAAQPDDRSE
jgi:hypothetical protein